MTDMNRHNRFKETGMIDEQEVSAWIEEALPGAERLIASSAPRHNWRPHIEASFAEPSTLPLGRWMGCYPELAEGKGKLTILRDWSVFLTYLFLAMEECGVERELLDKAFSDKSRLKIGIMNDVYQPFAPLPEPYSMVRHHSLILTLSMDWLTADEQKRWTEICGRAGVWIAGLLGEEADPLARIAEWEKRAGQIMGETASESCTDEGVSRLLANPGVTGTIKRYLQLTCFGMAVLLHGRESAAAPRKWAMQEIDKLHEADYLEQDILAYIAKFKSQAPIRRG